MYFYCALQFWIKRSINGFYVVLTILLFGYNVSKSSEHLTLCFNWINMFKDLCLSLFSSVGKIKAFVHRVSFFCFCFVHKAVIYCVTYNILIENKKCLVFKQVSMIFVSIGMISIWISRRLMYMCIISVPMSPSDFTLNK